MDIINTFIIGIISMITGFYSSTGFGNTIFIAPFVFFVIRQVIVIFKLMIYGLFTDGYR